MTYTYEYDEFIDEFWHADEVWDALSDEQLGRRTQPMLARWEREYEARPDSGLFPYSPAAMPGLLDAVFSDHGGYTNVTDFPVEHEHNLIREITEDSSSEALLALAKLYSGALSSALRDARKVHSSRLNDDELKRAVLTGFVDHIFAFDLSVPTARLMSSNGGLLLRRILPQVRQDAVDASLPVQVAGQRVSESAAGAKPSTTERVRAEDVKRIPNIGVLLAEMGDAVMLCGMVFTRAQVQMASDMAHLDRVQYARFGRIEPGSLHDWAYGDLPRDPVAFAMNRLSLVEDDRGSEYQSLQGVDFEFTVPLHLLSYDPVGEARMVTRAQRERIERLMSALTDRQADVVCSLFGIGRDPMTQEEYAEHYGISQQAVSKSLLGALGAMRKAESTTKEAL